MWSARHAHTHMYVSTHTGSHGRSASHGRSSPQSASNKPRRVCLYGLACYVYVPVCVRVAVLAGQRPGGKPPIPSASPAADPHTHRDTPDESSPVPRMPEPSESPAAVGLAGRAGRGRLGPAAPGGVGGPPHTPLPMGGPGVDDSTQMGAGSPAGSVTHTHTHTHTISLSLSLLLSRSLQYIHAAQ